MRRRAAGIASDDEQSDNDSEAETDDEDITRTVENLKVFCISSTEFLKLQGKLKKDGPPQVSYIRSGSILFSIILMILS